MRSRQIEEYKHGLKLTDVQREILVGILLGDACLETQDLGRTFRLKIEQSTQHEAYVRHIHEAFDEWVLSPPRAKRCTASNGASSMSWAFQTVSHSAFRFYAHQFYANGRKTVPKLIHRWLTPRGLAHWYMDDGSMKSNQSKGVLFNTHSFCAADVKRLCEVLQAKFAVKTTPRRQSDGTQIYVSGISFETFRALIEPFLITEMRYKVPQLRRTRLPKE